MKRLLLIIFFFPSIIYGQVKAGTQVVLNMQVDQWHQQQAQVYVPPDYGAAPLPCSTTKKNFPLIIYIHGVGDWSSINAVIQNGPGKIIQDSTAWKPEFILISPLFTWGWSNPSQIDAIINWAEKNLQVDSTMIYLTGISAGGEGCYWYVCASSYYASRIAAMVPMSAAGVDDFQTGRITSDSLLHRTVPTWDFCANNDPNGFYSINADYVNKLNASIPGQAHLTTIISNSHGPWIPFWSPLYKEGGRNVYDFLFSYKK